MDTPEQSTIWPPAPTIATPEAEQAKPFELNLPKWVSYWNLYGACFFVARYVIQIFCEVDHLHTPRWCSVPAAIAAWFVIGGLMTAWKYGPRRKRG